MAEVLSIGPIMHARPVSSLTAGRIATVPISLLVLERSVRTKGEDAEHVRMLAELAEPTPPIIVHRATMRVVDGLHRVRAAMLCGKQHIDVEFFDGDERNAFLLAVELNAQHGLPLSRADRVAAATRIVESHPDWSDRAIATLTGVGARTVNSVRLRMTAGTEQLNARLGKDGKVRPLSTAVGRELAGRLFRERPQASLREVAREAGISVGTARDVRQRLASGENLVPLSQRGPVGRDAQVPAARVEATEPPAPFDFRESLRSLTRDPSFRFSENGRKMLRLLDSHSVICVEWTGLVDSVPAHASEVVVEMARICAESWKSFAEVVRQRGEIAGD